MSLDKILELKRRLKRLEDMIDKKEQSENGNELNYTYWSGYELGYLKGKVSEIDREIHEIEFTDKMVEPKYNDGVYFVVPHRTPNKPYILHGKSELDNWYVRGDIMLGDSIYLGEFLKQKERYV